jgi:hypothetical protein
MEDIADTAQVIIRPPVAWGLAAVAGLALNWLVPLSFLPADLPAGLLGAMVFVIALALFTSQEYDHLCPHCGNRMLIIETFAAGCRPRHRPSTPLSTTRINTS